MGKRLKLCALSPPPLLPMASNRLKASRFTVQRAGCLSSQLRFIGGLLELTLHLPSLFPIRQKVILKY